MPKPSEGRTAAASWLLCGCGCVLCCGLCRFYSFCSLEPKFLCRVVLIPTSVISRKFPEFQMGKQILMFHKERIFEILPFFLRKNRNSGDFRILFPIPALRKSESQIRIPNQAPNGNTPLASSILHLEQRLKVLGRSLTIHYNTTSN